MEKGGGGSGAALTKFAIISCGHVRPTRRIYKQEQFVGPFSYLIRHPRSW